jgi:hypothetical protein
MRFMLLRSLGIIAAISVPTCSAFSFEAGRPDGVHVPHFTGTKAGPCGRRTAERVRAVMSGAAWVAFDRRAVGTNRSCERHG